MSDDWLKADWSAPAGIVAGTTMRQGGVSRGKYASFNLGAHVGDVPEHVARNRDLFRGHFGLRADPPWLQQVHGTQVIRNPVGNTIREGDAIYSDQETVICAVLTADCLPVLLCSTDGAETAAVHAGWRGLCNGVIEATLAEFAAPGESILAWLGPAISQDAFEVGDEVRASFLSVHTNAENCFRQNSSGRWQADLYALARQRLAASGVSAVSGGTRCTYSESDIFFSYRRDGQCGRMATFIARGPV